MPRNWLLTMHWVLAALLSMNSLAVSAKDTVLSAQVTHVTDGDSLWLTPDAPAAPVELRLLGIDAPEICQPWGMEAKQALAELVLHKQVTVKTVGRDAYGRTLGTVYLDTLNVNKTMVQEGHAWSTRYKHDRGPYVADERMAKALSRGLNREGGAIPPREFRRSHGPCTSEDVANVPAAGASLKPLPSAPATPPRPRPRPRPRRPWRMPAPAATAARAARRCAPARRPRGSCAIAPACRWTATTMASLASGSGAGLELSTGQGPWETLQRVAFRLSRNASRSSVSSGVRRNGTRMRSPSACSRFSSSSE